MPEAISTGVIDSLGRQVFVIDLPGLATFPSLSLPSPRFACLVACDSAEVTAAQLLTFGRSLIQQGAAYVCSWGPGCSDLEDAVDHAAVELDIEKGEESPVVMTTSHENETLDQALEFLSFSAFPTEEYADDCRTTLGIAVGNAEWGSQIRTWFVQEPPR